MTKTWTEVNSKSPPKFTRKSERARTGMYAAQRRAPYWLIAPAVILMAVFIAVPVVSVGVYSLFRWNVSKPWATEFLGLDNFRVIFTEDPEFWGILLTTVWWVGASVSLQFVLGLALALLLNQAFRGRSFVRSLSFAPWAISGVLATQIWLLIYNPATGIASVLQNIGISNDFAPLVGQESAFWAAVIAELWRGLPFFTIILLADMQSIPADLYEAAKVDGATRWQEFRHITVPYLKQAIILTTLLRAVWEFNNVDLLYPLTGGGPAGATTTLPLYIVNEAITGRNFGYGSALTVVGFVILAIFSVLYLRLTRGSRGEEQ